MFICCFLLLTQTVWCADAIDWTESCRLCQAATRLESVLDSSLGPLKQLHPTAVFPQLSYFHYLVNIAGVPARIEQQVARLLPDLDVQISTAVRDVANAAVVAQSPGLLAYNMFAVSHLAKHRLLLPVKLSSVGAVIVPGVTNDLLPVFKLYFNSVLSYAVVVRDLQDAHMATSGSRPIPSWHLSSQDVCTVSHYSLT